MIEEIEWIKYDFNNVKSRPKKPSRYLIWRVKCDKIHFEKWNGSGWSSSNNEELWWCEIKKPTIN